MKEVSGWFSWNNEPKFDVRDVFMLRVTSQNGAFWKKIKIKISFPFPIFLHPLNHHLLENLPAKFQQL